MILKFSCINHCLDFEIDSKELTNQSFRFCSYCGEKMKIENMNEVVSEIIIETVKRNTDEGLRHMGVEGFLEAVEKLTNEKTKKLFQTELKNRGIFNGNSM